MISGRHTYGVENVTIHRFRESAHFHYLRIGNFCSIAMNCEVFLGGNHYTNLVTTFPFGLVSKEAFPRADNPVNAYMKGSYSKGDVIIENDVWIGAHVTLMSGVHVGNGAVIAANSHVIKDVPPYAIVGGNPARVIKYRFTPHQIDALERIQWHQWSDEVINERVLDILSPDVDAFICKYDEQAGPQERDEAEGHTENV